jgi:hypothetical protein
MDSLRNADQNSYENGENIKRTKPAILSAILTIKGPVITAGLLLSSWLRQMKQISDIESCFCNSSA